MDSLPIMPPVRWCGPEGDAVLTLAQMEHFIATWVVKVWQNRRLGEFAPSWDPGGDHSPNTLFAASFAQEGFDLDIPSPETYYRFLPEHHVKRIYRRGVKVKGLWYDAELLHQPDMNSLRGGRYKKQWVIHREPRDRRMVYFQDPDMAVVDATSPGPKGRRSGGAAVRRAGAVTGGSIGGPSQADTPAGPGRAVRRG